MDNSYKVFQSTQKYSAQIGGAAKRKRGQIMSAVLMKPSLALFKSVAGEMKLNGIDLFCGQGDLTQELFHSLGPGSSVIGFDMDEINIRIARERYSKKEQGLLFHQLKSENWEMQGGYDFVYCRAFLNDMYSSLDLARKVYAALNPSGFAIFELLDTSNFQCVPQNHAHDRYVELIKLLRTKRNTSTLDPIQFQSLLTHVHFSKVHIQQVAPSFLDDDYKQIGSITLESISPILYKYKMSSQTELLALYYELKNFEKQTNTMISMPGVYQFVGYK